MCKVNRVTYHGTVLWVPEGTTTASIAIFLNTIASLAHSSRFPLIFAAISVYRDMTLVSYSWSILKGSRMTGKLSIMNNHMNLK